MTSEEIQRLRELCERVPEDVAGIYTTKLTINHKPTIEFFLAAHIALPQLLDEVERLRKENAECVTQTGEWGRKVGQLRSLLEKARNVIENARITVNADLMIEISAALGEKGDA